MKETRFGLRVPVPELRAWASRYKAADDEAALAAGRRISDGDHSRANLEAIARWKAARAIGHLARNKDAEIADALRLARLAKSDRAAVAVLCGLDGVDVRMASAILTAIDPKRYTVGDFRAAEALGVRTENWSVGFYLEYLDHCRKLAAEHGLELRALDRALWQWSSEAGKLGS